MLEQMSNKAFLRLIGLVITLVTSIGLLWSSWHMLSVIDRYVGIIFAVVIILTSVYFIIHAVFNLIEHREQVEAKKLARRIEAETHAHKLRLEVETHAHETMLARERFALEQHITLTRVLPGEHGYAALVERSTEGYQIVQMPYMGRPHPQLATVASQQPRPLATPQTRVIEMPTQNYILSQLRHNGLEVIPGVDVNTGECHILSIPDAVHFKLIGSSGFGKSCLAASLLDQAIQTNDPTRLQIALLDCEAKTSKLFQDAPHVVESRVGTRRIPLVSTNADEVAQHLSLLVAILQERAKLSEYDLQQLPVMVIYVEEMLSLQYEVDPKLLDRMLADLSILALRARKYNMFLLACSQTDYSTPELKTAQKQFRSRIAFAIDTTAARAAGFMDTELIKENFKTAQKGDGHFVMETPGYSGVMVAPSFDVRQMLLERSTPVRSDVQRPHTTPDLRIVQADSIPTERPLHDVLNAIERTYEASSDEIEQVCYLRSLNWGKQAICEKVWNVKKGGSAKWKEATAKYDAIIAEVETQKAEA